MEDFVKDPTVDKLNRGKRAEIVTVSIALSYELTFRSSIRKHKLKQFSNTAPKVDEDI